MWSRKYKQCIVCGRNDRPHMAKGKCSYCYSREYQTNPLNIDRITTQKENWYKENVTPAAQKLKREERDFSGNREVTLKRDNYECTRCGATAQLIVHHKNGKGRSVKTDKNNKLDNLITVCRSCHISIHRKSLYKSK